MASLRIQPLKSSEAFEKAFIRVLRKVRRRRWHKPRGKEYNPQVIIVGGELRFALNPDIWGEITKTLAAGVDILTVAGPYIIVENMENPSNPLTDYIKAEQQQEKTDVSGKLTLLLTESFRDAPDFHFLISTELYNAVQLEYPHLPSDPGPLRTGFLALNSIVLLNRLLNYLFDIKMKCKKFQGEAKYLDEEGFRDLEREDSDFKNAWKQRIAITLKNTSGWKRSDDFAILASSHASN